MNCGFKKQDSNPVLRIYQRFAHVKFFLPNFQFFHVFLPRSSFSPIFRSKTYQKPLYSVFFCAILDLSIPFLCNTKRPALSTTGYNNHLCNNDNILVCGLQGFLMVKVEKIWFFCKRKGFLPCRRKMKRKSVSHHRVTK